MQKLVIILIVVALGSVGVALYSGLSCGAFGNAAPDDTRHTLIDMTGHRVVLPASPRRVLSLSAMANNIIVKLGLAERLAAIDRYGQLIPGVEHAEIVGKDSALSIEKIIALKIDLAFVWWYQESAADLLQNHGIPVVRLTSCRLANYVDVVEFIADCFNAGQAASAINHAYLQQLDGLSLVNKAERPKVYIELYSPYKTVGRDTYVNDLVEAAGGKNIADDIGGAALLSAEIIVKKSPEVIIYIEGFGNAGEIASRPGFHVLSAVRRQRVKSIDRRWLVAGVDPIGAIQAIRRVIHEKSETRQ